MGKVVSQDELWSCVTSLKRDGKSVVFTNGCFDLLHPGHVWLLERARSLGDILVVAINSDASVRTIKGSGRPAMPQAERAEVLAALAPVDFVVIFDEPTPKQLIAGILPSILVKGSDWGADEIVGRDEVEAAGGRVESIPVKAAPSTTSLIESIRKLRA